MEIPGVDIDRSLVQTEQSLLSRWGSYGKPKVSISCITYNHEHYISDALDGFLIQETDFPFEILVHDDASTDGTADIIRDYEKRYPRIIKPVYQKINQYSRNKRPSRFNYERAQGDFIAVCEGDDYWIDSRKLSRQIGFLIDNPGFSLCFHDAVILYQDGKNQPLAFSSVNKKAPKKKFTIQDIILSPWFIPTASIVFRTCNLENPLWLNHIFTGDYALQLIQAAKGDLYGFDEIMSVYRMHSSNLYRQLNYSQIDVTHRTMDALLYFNMHTDFKYDSLILKRLDNTRKELYETLYEPLLNHRSPISKLLSIDYYRFKLRALLGRDR
ncbi:MAG: glycosyltransferase [Pseudomonadota bacterium]